MRFEQGAEIVRQRSMGLCEMCRARGTQTHHRRARGMGGRKGAGLAVNLPCNLIRVCNDCHTWIERNPAAADDLGLLHPADGSDPVWLHTLYGLGWFVLTEDGCYLFDHSRPLPAFAVVGPVGLPDVA